MREILFRAKPKSQKDYSFFEATFPNSCNSYGFVFGSLLIDNYDRSRYYITATVLSTLNCTVNNTQVSAIRAIPETVCQYTGLADKNTTKIFDRDILFDTSSGHYYQVKYFEEYARYGLANKAGKVEIGSIEDFINDMVVVGNMIDNPERLR